MRVFRDASCISNQKVTYPQPCALINFWDRRGRKQDDEQVDSESKLTPASGYESVPSRDVNYNNTMVLQPKEEVTYNNIQGKSSQFALNMGVATIRSTK